MTYVSKKEKVFDLPEQEESSTTSLDNFETRLKRFPSVSDRRAWTTEESLKYQHLYGLVNGSESSLVKSTSFKYIPFDVLLAILMAEKDAYIQELLERQDDKSCCGGKANVLYKAEGFEDSDDDRDALIRKDAEMVALKNKIAGLESELEDYRDTLTKAMHKLENMDSIMSENNLLREKLKYSEETIKCLEARKQELEKEIQFLGKRSSESESETDENECRSRKKTIWNNGDCEELVRLYSERDLLLLQVEELQKEVERTRVSAAEMEVLRKMSETTSASLEEISRENECYKKKLETMKCLEKHIEELKKQAEILTDKYKRESRKADDHFKEMNQRTRELQVLRDEKERLQRRVEELVNYETQYKSLQSKLHQVEMILDENEMLNKKLIQLDRLELENEHLKMKSDRLKEAEIQAADDKEKIFKLQCAIADQEEEIKKMLRQIEELSRGYAEKNEILRLQNELDEKNRKLNQYERQLKEIPILESEIEELRKKLQKCIDDFKSDKELLKRLQEELEACRTRCRELEEMAPLQSRESLLKHSDKTEPEAEVENSKADNWTSVDPILHEDAASQCSVKICKEISVEAKLNESKTEMESFAELEELKGRNEILKNEVEILRSKLSEIDLDELLGQTNVTKEMLREKEEKIMRMEEEICRMCREESEKCDEIEGIKENLENLERETSDLRRFNKELKREMETIRRDNSRRVKELEKCLEAEKKAREFAIDSLGEIERKLMEERRIKKDAETLSKLQKEEANVAKQGIYQHFSSEISFLKGFNVLSRKLIDELKTENLILRQINEYSERIEKNALRGLVRQLKAKAAALKSLSKAELDAECKSVRENLGYLIREADGLAEEIADLKNGLESEKKVRDDLEKVLIGLRTEVTDSLSAETRYLGREIAEKDDCIAELRTQLANSEKDLEVARREAQDLREANAKLRSEEANLKKEIDQLSEQVEAQNDLESEIDRLSDQIERQKMVEVELKRLAARVEQQKNLEEELSHLSKRLEEKKDLEKELNALRNRLAETEKRVEELERREEELLKEMQDLKSNSSKQRDDLLKSRILEEGLRNRVEELKEALRVKEEEMMRIEERQADLEAETERRKSEMEAIKVKLSDRGQGQEEAREKEIDEKYALEERYSLEEKQALEEAMRKIENELDGLKIKMSECRRMEEEMAALRNKRDSLAMKLASFEAEIDSLKRKLSDFEDLKLELDLLKAEKQSLTRGEEKNGSDEFAELRSELDRKKAEVENPKAEKEILWKDSTNAEKMAEASKGSDNTVSQIEMIPHPAEYFTPPAVPSPRSPDNRPEEEMAVLVSRHRREIAELESRFTEKIRQLKESNAKKVKKLTSYHEKDAKCRTRAFHDSVNNMKSKYEREIRKLVEKHKSSIATLQNLHEEEVKELTKNYETQLDAMEKQNDDLIDHVRLESAEKCKQTTDRCNKDLEEMEKKYEAMLKEKDEQIQAEKANLEASMASSTNSLQEVHKQTVDSLTQFCRNSIVELEEKHSREMRKCKKNNQKKIELVMNKYENLLVEERKKYEEQLEEMLRRLKKGQQGVMAEGDTTNFVQRTSPESAGAGLEFIEVLQKIINEGLESLTFDELILVHGKTCFLPETASDREEEGGGEVDGCKHRILMAAEREELLRRIFTLERKIVIKQLETHEAILNMEAAEKYRIQELKSALSNAQQKNIELKKHLSNYVNLEMEKYAMDHQVPTNENGVAEKMKELEREKAEKKFLEEELQREKANVKNLTSLLESEKERFNCQRKRDSDYVEFVKRRLEEALSHKQMIESQLDFEAGFRAKLETELQTLQKSFNYITDLPSTQLPSKAVKDLRNFDQCETAKEEIHGRNRSGRPKGLPKVLHNL